MIARIDWRHIGLPSGILVLSLLGFFGMKSMKSPPAELAVEDFRPVVLTHTLEESSSRFDIVVDGTVEPKRELTVTAEVAGQVITKAEDCDSGQYVEAGTVLMEIEPDKFELEVKRLRYLVEQAQAECEHLEQERNNNETMIKIHKRDVELRNSELERMTTLHADGTVPDGERNHSEIEAIGAQLALQQLLNAQAIYPSTLEKAHAEKELRQARLKAAEIDLANTRVVAPIAGYVCSDPVEINQYVTPGTPLFCIEDTSSVEVHCNLRVDDLFWLWSTAGQLSEPNQEAGKPYYEAPPVDARVVYKLGERAVAWPGKLTRYGGLGVDEKTRTVPCLVEVSHPRRRDVKQWPPTLVRGMFVTVEFHAAPKTPILRIPDEAVQLNDEVWTFDDGKLRIHEVRVAKVLPDWILVRAGETDLKAGDKLIVSPLATAIDGMSVREKDTP